MNGKLIHFCTFFSAISPLVCFSQANLQFIDDKNFTQLGPEEFRFDGGLFDLDLRDGAVLFFALGEGQVPTGQIEFANGNNGLFSIPTPPVDFMNIEPLRADEIVHIFPTNSVDLNWVDQSPDIFYFPDSRNYDVTEYIASINYGPTQLDDMYDDLTPGSYVFRFPGNSQGLNTFVPPFEISVPYERMIEPFPGFYAGSGQRAFRLSHDDEWVNGAIEVDSSLNDFTFLWEGASEIGASDTMSFSVIDQMGNIVFPPSGVPVVINPTLGDPIDRYELPLFFAIPGDNLTACLDIQRQIINTADFWTDSSRRTFKWNISPIETYARFAEDSGIFPADADESLLGPEADFDGDGVSNFAEFAQNTDPTNPAAIPAPLITGIATSGNFFVEVPKNSAAGSFVTYDFESSTDIESGYETINMTDGTWTVVQDNANILRIELTDPTEPLRSFVRARFTDNS